MGPDVIQTVRVAVRSLLRQRGFTIVAVLTLALGVGATTAIFSVVYGILLRPLPYPDAERLVAIGGTSRKQPTEPVSGSVSHVDFLDFQRTATTVTPMALFSARLLDVNLGEADVVTGAIVTPAFFDVFASRPMMGRTFTPDEDRLGGPLAVVISYRFWQDRLGGRPDVLSQTLDVVGQTRPIVGVAPPGFDFPRRAQIWMPIRNDDAQCGRGCVYLNGIGRLADGATPQDAQRELAGIALALEREFPNTNNDSSVMVQTLHERTVGSVQTALVVLLASVLMVLLIACANVANLVLVRGAARQDEIAVRAALGAGRRGIVSYLLTENLVLAIAGGALGLLFASFGVDALTLIAPADLPRLDDIRFDVPTFVFALGMVLLTTMTFGLGPALRLSGVPLVQALGHRGSVGSSRQRWTRSTLLAVEVGLSLVLLLGAGLLLRSLTALQRTELGFEITGRTTFAVALPAARYSQDAAIAFHERLDEAMSAVPGVSRVSRVSELPLGTAENVQGFMLPDQPPPPPGGFSARIARVDPDYFESLRIPILSGRNFTLNDRRGSPDVVIVSRRMAEVFWPGINPVGRPIRISDRETGMVVGIAGDVRSTRPGQAPRPEMFVPHAQFGDRTANYILQGTLDAASTIAAARQVLQRFDSQLPLRSTGSMEQLRDRHLGRPQFYVVLLGLFAVLASVLAAVGIYGVVAYAVAQRTREIGVRMALGARRADVIGLMLWQGLRPAIVGIGAGLVTAFGAGQLIRGLLYGVQPYDPLTFAGVTLALLVIVGIACAIPARRASTVAPAQALRGE
jgi:putative ABC transport system permease protein